MEKMIDVSIEKKLSTENLISIDFQAPPGLTVLFGRSGAGKSITLQCIAGLLRPDSGRIYLGKTPFFDSEKKVNMKPPQRKVGYVFQSCALFPHLDVVGNVAIGMRGAKKEVKQKVEAILREVGISHLASRYPGELSGGEQQRVALARALGRNPQLLFLDEPFSALDAPVKDKMRKQLKAIQKRRKLPVIFITHQPDEAFVLANYIVVINKGRVEQTGSVEDIFFVPKNRSIARLVGTKNIFAGTIEQTVGDSTFVRTKDFLVHSNGPNGFKTGEKVDWCIRPENVIILREDWPLAAKVKENVISGRVSEIESQGPTWSLLFSSPSISLKIDVPAHAATHLKLFEGKKISVSLKKQSIHLIKRGADC